MKGAFVAVLALIVGLAAAKESEPLVTTDLGQARGVWGLSEPSTKTYASFTSLPYARPPVGDLRFARPQPLSG
jgi:carboxylesterase type B